MPALETAHAIADAFRRAPNLAPERASSSTSPVAATRTSRRCAPDKAHEEPQGEEEER